MSQAIGKAIRQIIKKEFGLNSRQVSVRVSHTSVNVKVKKAGLGVTPEMIRGKIKGYETIHRCPVTGDILGGGNFFVFADWASGVHEPRKEKLNAWLAENPFHYGMAIVFGGDRYQLITGFQEGWLRLVNTKEEQLGANGDVWYENVAHALARELGHLSDSDFEAMLEGAQMYDELSVNEVVEAYRCGKFSASRVRMIAKTHREGCFLEDLLAAKAA